jgi:TonB family protein
MKVEMKNVLTVLLTLVIGLGVANAQPETTELKEPQVIRVVEPIIPVEYRGESVEGLVKVTFRITEDGRPHEIEVESATHDAYAISVKKAIRQWRYEVPSEAGRKYRLPVYFN